MKKIRIILTVIFCLLLSGCTGDKPEIVSRIDTAFATYYELDDGAWTSNGIIYKYRLEINGRMPGAAVDSTFVYLSNIVDIPFERAWKAAGFSSSTDDFFPEEEAIFVDMRTN